MRCLLFSLAALLGTGLFPARAAEPTVSERHYRVFRGDGSPAAMDDVVAAARKATVTLLGESHDDPVAHHLELELLRQLAAPDLALSLEMFERDVQGVVDEYLAGLITEEHLKASGRAWKNYATGYRLLVELAKERKLPVLAANAPRRYVNRASRLGAASLEELSADAQRWLAPLPYAEASPAYAERFQRVMEEARRESEAEKKGVATSTPASPPAVAPPRREMDPVKALAAQGLWDSTMAFAIADHLTRHPGSRVLHVQGSFHGERRLGVPEHLERYRPGVERLVVTMLPSKQFPAFDAGKMRDAGDFVIVTDAELTRMGSAMVPTGADGVKHEVKAGKP